MEKTTLKTNGLCCICLERVVKGTTNNFVSLDCILHYLCDSVNKCVQVELCHSCEKINARLSTLFVNSEKIKMEISYYLNQTHERIAKSKSKRLTERYSKVMTKDAKSLSQLVHVDKLRKELLIKCRDNQNAPQLQVKLIRLGANTKDVAIRKKIAKNNESCEPLEDTLPSPDSCTDLQPPSPTPASPGADVNDAVHEEGSSPVFIKLEEKGAGVKSQSPYLTPQENCPPSSPDSSIDFQTLSPSPASPVAEENDTSEIVSPSGSGLEELPTTKDNFNEQKGNELTDGPRKSKINKKRKPRNNLKCDLCPLKFENKNELHKHERTHKVLIEKCPICKEVYSTKADMDQHMSTHKPEEVFQCDICQKYLKSKQVLKFHRNLHQPLEKRFPSLLPVKCSICGKTLNKQTALTIHMKKVHGQEISSPPVSPNFDSQCTVCKRLLKDSQGFNLHIAKYHTAPEEREAAIKKALSCAICNKTLLTLYGLKVHQKSHKGEKSFLCEFCPKTFVQKGILQQHLKRIHYDQGTKRKAENTPETPTCPVCDKEFKVRSRLKDHLNKVHRPFVKTSSFQCDTCGAAFSHERSLKAHIFLLHVRNTEKKTCMKPNRKYFQCPICKKMICDSQRNLKMHMRTHTGEKPFKCELCGKAFSVASYLRDHKLNKHFEGSKPYVCGLCGRGFIRPYLLDYHRHKVHKVSKEDGTLPSVTPSLFKNH